jgi:hypothetical protein
MIKVQITQTRHKDETIIQRLAGEYDSVTWRHSEYRRIRDYLTTMCKRWGHVMTHTTMEIINTDIGEGWVRTYEYNATGQLAADSGKHYLGGLVARSHNLDRAEHRANMASIR